MLGNVEGEKEREWDACRKKVRRRDIVALRIRLTTLTDTTNSEA